MNNLSYTGYERTKLWYPMNEEKRPQAEHFFNNGREDKKSHNHWRTHTKLSDHHYRIINRSLKSEEK